MALGQVLAVVSGKGGTGKTSLCAAVACCLAAEGKSVVCIDADVGLRNLDLSLGLAQEPALPFSSVMRGEYSLQQATVHPSYPNLRFLTAPVMEAPEDLDRAQFSGLLAQIRQQFDWCLIDAPAGIGAGFQLAVQDADQMMIVTGADPAALRDGARAAQAVSAYTAAPARIVVNRIRRRFFRRTRFTVDDCMDQIGLPLLGIVPEDEAVPLCAARGVALIASQKKGAGLACLHIARRLCGQKQPLLPL